LQLQSNDRLNTIDWNEKTLFQVAEDYAEPIQMTELPFEVPRDPQAFYEHFGLLPHDFNRGPDSLPTPVKKLAWYQLKFMKWDFGVCLKSNKLGMTTSEMIEDFHTRLLPESAGYDCILAAPKQETANDLVMKLKKLVAGSKIYSQFLIKRPDFMEFKEEKTKIGVMVIANPYQPERKSKIIAAGTSLSSVFSKMGINRIHITDPSLMKIKKQDDYFAGLFARIANTGGQIKIEGIPLYRSGWFWKLCKVLFKIEDTFEDSRSPAEKLNDEIDEYELPPEITQIFQTIKLTIEDGVAAGVIPASVRDTLKKSMSPAKYKQTFMAEFLPPEGAAFGGSFGLGEHELEVW